MLFGNRSATVTQYRQLRLSLLKFDASPNARGAAADPALRELAHAEQRPGGRAGSESSGMMPTTVARARRAAHTPDRRRIRAESHLPETVSQHDDRRSGNSSAPRHTPIAGNAGHSGAAAQSAASTGSPTWPSIRFRPTGRADVLDVSKSFRQVRASCRTALERRALSGPGSSARRCDRHSGAAATD
jgi:hypothetical protein